MLDEQRQEGSHVSEAPTPQPERFFSELSEPVNSSQVGLILNTLAQGNSPTAGTKPSTQDFQSSQAQTGPVVRSTEESVFNDPEIREAYTDDARRCLSSIETSLLAYEEQPLHSQPLQQLCRDLHTLKGASASVGLDKLAHFLHQVEDDLQSACENNTGAVDLQPIFQVVDAVREQMPRVRGGDTRKEKC